MSRSNEQLSTDTLRMYRMSLRIRLFEEKLAEMFETGVVYGTAHPCIGQEAVAVGALFDARLDDFVTGTHRSHGHCIAKGADIGRMMLELCGREGGYCGGKGGSMHIADLELNMLGCNGLVAGGIPHAAGAALAARLRGEDRVAIAFLGDGAANQGVLYETLNLAMVQKISLIVVCENNQYALSARYAETQATENIASKAAGFGVPARVVDGMDPFAIRAAMAEAVSRARSGGGPSFIECKTYRFLGHSLRTDRPKRAIEEIESWRARDPIALLRRSLRDDHGIAAAVLDAVEQEEQAAVQVAAEAAVAAPEPPIDALVEGVFYPETIDQVVPVRTEKDEKRQVSYAAALNEALHQEMARDDRILIFGEDVGEGGGVFGVTKDLQARFGVARCWDTPISEQAITGLGVGLALAGMRPVVEIQFMDILTLATDQLVNQAAKLRYMLGGKPTVPMVLRTPLGAGVKLGAQHSQSLEAWYAHVPGLLVALPSTPYDAKGLLVTALRSRNPVLFLEHKLLYFLAGPVPEERYSIPFGVAEVKRQGTDVTVVAWSGMVRKCLQVARRLGREGVSVEVVDPRTIVPLDMDTIVASVRKTGRLVVVHEACRFGGFGGEIVAQVVEAAYAHLKAPPRRVGAPQTPVPYNARLEAAFIPSESEIIEAVKKTLAPS